MEHIKKEPAKTDRRPLIIAAIIFVVLGGGAALFAYIGVSGKTVSIDKAQISAPIVTLSSGSGGVLQHLYVTAGQVVPPNTVVAQVGVELIKSTAGGLVLDTKGDIGDKVAPSAPVVEMIDPASLRVVGKIDENKGLSKLKVGDQVTFTVDAFGSKEFNGVLEEISPTSNQSGVVFNISSQREVQQFDVKARFDTASYPELKNGMSARMSVWIQ